MDAPSVSPVRLVFLGASTLALCLSWSFGCTRELDAPPVVREDNPGDRALRAEEKKVDADAVAKVAGPLGTGAHGFVRFEAKDGKTRVIADFAGLPPGEHGFHIHENGACDEPDFMSAGEHLAGKGDEKYPHLGEAHGLPDSERHHEGDMGNVVADGHGSAHFEHTFDGLLAKDLIGRAVIVHMNPDEGDPAGKTAGARIACGVVTKPTDDVVRSSGVEHGSTTPDEQRTLPGRDPAQPRDNAIPPLTPPVPAIP